ncbi:MAG: hypothetical protein HQK67_07265 [Desulfamplus sp.]|nr:hypothetical protein [Desulfamplus sp.]
MISDCPNCNQALNFSDANKSRILNALDKLPQGQTLKFKCPMCKNAIELASDGFPLSDGLPSVSLTPVKPEIKSSKDYANKIAVPPPAPPDAPDISWLTDGTEIDSSIVENIMTAMILLPDDYMQHKIAEILKKESYQIYIPKSIDEAIESIRFKDYAIIVYHSEYENRPLKDHDFHKFMQQMSMKKRRYIYYILFGNSFKTLYDLEALVNSANVVINDKEIPFLSTILKKLKSDYNLLFKTYCSVLKTHGKS